MINSSLSVTLPMQVTYLQGTTWLTRELRHLPSRDPGGAEFYTSELPAPTRDLLHRRSTTHKTSVLYSILVLSARDLWQFGVCTKFSSAVPKRRRSAKPSPFRVHTTTTREAKTQAYTSLEHFPGPLMSNLELLADMTMASGHIVVAMGDLIAIIHCKSKVSSRHT